MRWSWSRILDSILVLCAVAVTIAVVSRTAWFDETPADGAVNFDGWRQNLEFDRRIGPDDAPYRLAVWMDYQCPACRAFEKELAGVRAQLEDSLAVVYRHYPLSNHPLAFPAAVAAECAYEQGQFEAMHRALLALPLDGDGDSLPVDSLIARSEITDPAAFRRCMADSTSAVSAAVRSDIDWARELNLRGTPGVQIGDRVSTGGMRADEVLRRLRETSR